MEAYRRQRQRQRQTERKRLVLLKRCDFRVMETNRENNGGVEERDRDLLYGFERDTEIQIYKGKGRF